jgi:NADH-quinone oxidoreductase subunit J
MKDLYLFLLITILIFFSVQTNTMFSLFSFIIYASFLFLSFFFFKIEFLAYLFFIIYMGAIIVLFLFVIMLIEFKPIKTDNLETAFIKILLVFVSFYIFLISIKTQKMDVKLNILKQTFWKENIKLYDLDLFKDYLDIVEIGLILYDSFLVLFINITMLFALGIISVVLLTKEQVPVQFERKKVINYYKLI